MATAQEKAAPSPVARLAGVTHTYGAVTAVADITLDVPSECMVGVLGPDGVGKSSMLALISGARQIQQGSVTVLDHDMSDGVARRTVGPRIAYMPQGLGKSLYQDLSVIENLDFFGKLFDQAFAERRARAERLTRATGLFPFLDRPAKQLSGGMKQKLGLCCALINAPDLLILDEPTTGVDPLSRRQFWDLIDSIRAERPGMSVIVSTAYMDEAERFDWLAAMSGGRVLATGAPSELRERTGQETLEAAFVSLLGDAHTRPGAFEVPPFSGEDGEPVIVARNLTRRFGKFTAVDDVSFDIRRGEIFGFLGSNGCGKTTTMKMLTGLLQPTEGEAFLFGRKVDAGNLETRKRVGFMSQSFSLYGELTVRQNLSLHGRLFQLSADRVERRTEDLLRRFELLDYQHADAADLPLGIRQRLSLAVAIIHEPDMLILDEPTSGVDPVARDDFWHLLVDLSRNQGVTIFISTHFMNEALRCDRISLMHQGRVLVCDTPEAIRIDAGSETLEDAFIKHIEEAHVDVAPDDEAADDTAVLVPVGAAGDGAQLPTSFSLTRLLAYSYRETLEVMRDPVRLAFAFVGTVVLLILMAYGITQDVSVIRFADFDQDRSPASRAYLKSIEGSHTFERVASVTSRDALDDMMQSNRISLAIEIPPGFGRAVATSAPVELSAWIDGADTQRAGTVQGYVTGAHLHYVQDHLRRAGIDVEARALAQVETRNRYNPTGESIYAMGPSVPAMLLMLFPAILMAVSVAREKEIGTITNFYVTPSRRVEFLVGKQLPYIAIGLINFLTLVLLIVFLMGVPLKGSVVALFVGTIIYVAASTGYGLVISSLTKNQVAAVFAAAILSMLPTMQFSGMIEPVSTLEGPAYVIGSLWPTTYFMHLSVGAFTKGLWVDSLWTDLLALAVFPPVFLAIAVLLLREQER